MREIKFRAWDGKQMDRKWRDGRLVIDASTGEAQKIAHGSTPFNVTIPHGLTLMQASGLKDKNGVEIYEGDVVRFTYWWFDGNEAESELLGSVVYIQEHASYGLEGVKNAEWIKHIGGEEGSSDTVPFANWTFSPDDIEVIGNIYENPELLESAA